VHNDSVWLERQVYIEEDGNEVADVGRTQNTGRKGREFLTIIKKGKKKIACLFIHD
jgi:hypothetical protein